MRDDDDDENLTPSGNPKRRVIAAGATADPVKDYLKQIGRVSLLNAEQEVDLSERIEAGLYAQHLLDTESDGMDFKRKRELKWAANDGKKAKGPPAGGEPATRGVAGPSATPVVACSSST